MVRKIIESKYTPFIVMGIIFLTYMSFVKLMTYADDVFFSTVLDHPSEVFAFLSDRYMTWSSRLSIDFFATLIMRENLWVWRILNTVVCVLLIFGIYRICLRDTDEISYKLRIFFVIWITFMLCIVHWDTMEWGAFWVTGSFNYLWPTAFMVLSLYFPFKLFDGQDFSKKNIFFYFFFILYFGFQEQAVLVFACFLAIALLYYYLSYGKINYTGIWLLLFSVFCLLFIALSPGNHLRFKREIMAWYPEFVDMSLVEKLYSGFAYTVLHNFISNNGFVVIIISCLIIYLFLNNEKSIYWKVISFIPLIYIFGGFICRIFNLSGLYDFLAISKMPAIDGGGGDNYSLFILYRRMYNFSVSIAVL